MVSSSDISILRSKIYSQTTSISQNLSEALTIAQYLEDLPLIYFCEKELLGWDLECLDNEDPDQKPTHRLIDAFASLAEINLQSRQWGGDSEKIFSYMSKDQHFFYLKWLVGNPVNQIECRQSSNSCNEIVIKYEKVGNVFIDSPIQPDRTVFIYARVSSYLGILESIRIELTKRLLILQRNTKKMEDERKLRHKVLNTISKETNLRDISKAINCQKIHQETGIDLDKVIEITKYLEQRNLIEFAYDDGLQPYFTITVQGIDELENIAQAMNQSDKQLPHQVFNNTFNSPIGGFQQGGEKNISNVIQNIGLDEVALDAHALEKLQELVHALTTDGTNNLSKSQAYQAAGILMELTEAAENLDKNRQIEVVSKWRQWFSGAGEKAQTALSIVADCISLGLPLAKLLGLPVP